MNAQVVLEKSWKKGFKENLIKRYTIPFGGTAES